MLKDASAVARDITNNRDLSKRQQPSKKKYYSTNQITGVGMVIPSVCSANINKKMFNPGRFRGSGEACVADERVHKHDL